MLLQWCRQHRPGLAMAWVWTPGWPATRARGVIELGQSLQLAALVRWLS
jgi:hypothetical protein